MLNLKYSTDKEELRKNILLYYKEKDKAIKKLLKANLFALENPEISGTEVGKMFNIDRNMVYRWRGRNSSARLPSNFMTYEQFLLSL